MISSIIRFSVFRPIWVLVLTVALALGGWWSFTHLSIDAVPDITNTQVQVFADATGMAPEEVERSVTFPMEKVLAGVPGVVQIRSITRFGLTVITVVFEDGADIYRARQLVAERIQIVASELPRGANPKLGPISTGLGEIFFYSIEAETPKQGPARKEQLMELRQIQEYVVKPRLLTVKGVAEVNTIGGFEKQYHVKPNPELLKRYGIGFSHVVQALEVTNRNVGGGYVQQSSEQFLVQGNGLLLNEDQILDTPIKVLDSLKTLRIRDVAKVEVDTGLRTGAALVRGEEAVIGMAMMLIGENSREVALRVGERLSEIKESLPKGYRLEPVYDRADLVTQTLGTVEHNLLTGATLVIVVLFLLLGNIRAAVITALVIPLTLLATFIIMKRLDISGNLVSLGALDFGIIVDGTVIVLDHCIRKLRAAREKLGRALTSEERRTQISEAAIEIRSTAGFGELIVVVVFLPVLALTGIEGKTFRPMASTFAIAVAWALVLSFTTVPALASLLLKAGEKESDPFLMRWTERGFARILTPVMRVYKFLPAFAVATVVLGIFLFSRLGGEFLPRMDEASRALQFVRPVNISLDQSLEWEKKGQKIIAGFPQVKSVFSRLGTPELATDPMGVNLSDNFVVFQPREKWPKEPGSPRTWTELTRQIVEQLETVLPGQRVIISQPIQMRFNELLEGSRADVSVKIFGDDMDQMVETGEKLVETLRKVPGAGDVELELRGASPMLRVTPRDDFTSGLGIPKQEILETVNIAMAGEEVGYLFEGMRRYPILVRLDEHLRSDLDVIRELPVEVANGTTLPLAKVASVQFDEVFSVINREQGKRRINVMVNPRGRDTESFVHEAQKLIRENVKIPPGVYLEWGGNFKNLKEARARLLVLTPIAIIMVLAMIFFAFRSIPQTLLVFFCAPLALVGGVINMNIQRIPFSISAGVGFIALMGIAVLNGVVLVNCINDLRREGLRGIELVRAGVMQRLRPVLMTALVAAFGFLPMMLSTGVGAEVQRPLATVVIGGILSSTILTLITLPGIYLIFERWMTPAEDAKSLGH